MKPRDIYARPGPALSINFGIAGICFYSLNPSASVQVICENLSLGTLAAKG